MDESEFLESLKTDEERFDEFTAGAEHFVRLKKQSGYERPQPGLEKEAATRKGPFGRFMEGMVGGSPVEHLAKGMRTAAKGPNRAGGLGKTTAVVASGAGMFAAGRHSERKKEKRAGIEAFRTALRENPMLRSAVLSGVASGAIGAGVGAASSPGDRLGGAVRSGASSAVTGAAGGALLHHLGTKLASDLEEKRASMADKLKSLGPLSLAIMGAGAATGGVGTYLASKPRKELGGKSRAEDELEAQVQAQQGRPETGLLHKMRNRTTELEHGYAKAFRDHPGKASILGAGAGAAGGYGLARLLDAVRGAS